jgi:hypothetical protein
MGADAGEEGEMPRRRHGKTYRFEACLKSRAGMPKTSAEAAKSPVRTSG